MRVLLECMWLHFAYLKALPLEIASKLHAWNLCIWKMMGILKFNQNKPNVLLNFKVLDQGQISKCLLKRQFDENKHQSWHVMKWRIKARDKEKVQGIPFINQNIRNTTVLDPFVGRESYLWLFKPIHFYKMSKFFAIHLRKLAWAIVIARNSTSLRSVLNLPTPCLVERASCRNSP